MFERVGKVVVATDPSEVPALEELHARGRANGVPELARIDSDRLREIEPHARGVAALHSPATAVADFAAVARCLAQLVRDQGFSASAELRIPLWRDRVDGRTRVQLAPFFDVGGGWDRNRPTPPTGEIYSFGAALRVEPWPFVRGELTWARRLVEIERPDGLQGNGIQFQIVVDLL